MRALYVFALALCIFAPPGLAQEANQVGADITVELLNGDIITGELVSQTAIEIVIDHPYIGFVTINRAAIKPPAPPSEGGETAAVDSVEVKSPWSGSADASFSGKRGNTQEQDFIFNFATRRDDKRTIDTYRGTYEKSLSEVTKTNNNPPPANKKTTDTTTDQYKVLARREWFLNDTAWRPFIAGSVESDEFKAYSKRLRAAAGVAYPWIENDQERFVGSFGLAATKDTGKADDNTVNPELLLGLEYFTDFGEGHSFNADYFVFPALEGGSQGEYQHRARAEYAVIVQEGSPWTLKLGAEHERDTDPADGDAKNDLTYYVGAGYTF